jgi:hypothetical protein
MFTKIMLIGLAAAQVGWTQSLQPLDFSEAWNALMATASCNVCTWVEELENTQIYGFNGPLQY